MRMKSGLYSLIGHGAIVAIIVMGCGNNSPTGPTDEVPTFGSCNLEPNFIGEVGLNRWRTFPLSYFFDAAAFTPEFVNDYEQAINTGIRRWNESTDNSIGAVAEVDDPENAQFIITFRDVMPATSSARTFHATGTPFLAGGEIAFNRANLTLVEQRVRDGEISRQGFFNGLAAIAAHEMGHLLGIVGHPDGDDSLMGETLNETPTILDINTLTHAYCQ